MLDEKMSELEDRNRRNNLRFENVAESENETWEDSENKIRNVITTRLGISTDKPIERAHRTGRKEAGRKRTIVAKFLNYKDREKVLQSYFRNKLWEGNEPVYINEDFSERTLTIRKGLFQEMKEFKNKGVKSKVSYKTLIKQKVHRENNK